MPAKTYVQVPNGDFRAMPAQGGGLAILKWITSFPGNPDSGLPVVQGVISVSRAETGEPVALIDARAVTERTSTSASGCPSSAEDTHSTPMTTGSPRAGLPGNEVTHLRIARPAPFAGIARKSPCGEASR